MNRIYGSFITTTTTTAGETSNTCPHMSSGHLSPLSLSIIFIQSYAVSPRIVLLPFFLIKHIYIYSVVFIGHFEWKWNGIDK